MAVKVLTYDRITRVNVEKPTLADMDDLRECYSHHPLDLEDCLSRIERTKVDDYDDYPWRCSLASMA